MKSGEMLMALAALATIALSGCGDSQQREATPVRNVLLTEVSPAGESVATTYSGVVEEGKSVNAAFMTGGKLLSLYVKEGDRVRKGQLIAALDDADYQIGVNQLRVQLQQMTAEKNRMDEMFARHNIAPNDYEKFQAGYEQLKLQLEMADNKLGYSKLYAPSDGFVAYKYMQPGELVDAGTPIYKITDDTSLEVALDLPVNVYLNRNEIRKAIGKTPGAPDGIPLAISSFTPDADNNQLYHMKLDIPAAMAKQLTPGMNMPVEIVMQNESRGETQVPSRAIFDENGKTYVWVFNDSDSTISRMPVVTIGAPYDRFSRVSGLNGDEKIVSAGVRQLKQGEKVNPIAPKI